MSEGAGPVTVLMADDDPDDRMMAGKAFGQLGQPHDLRFVSDGEELTDYLFRRGQYEDPARSPRPALLLLDLNMPRKDGWEALRELKADPDLRQIRVVILTTSGADADVRRAYDVSATSFITKPASYSALVAAVRSLGGYWLETVELPRGG